MTVLAGGRPHHFVIAAGRTWDGHSTTAPPGRAVVVRDDRIEAVVDRGNAPRGLPWLELPDCTLLPGLIDAHVHLTRWMLPVLLAAGVTTVRDLGNDLATVLSWRQLVRTEPTLGPDILCCGPLLDGSIVHWPRFGRGHRDPAALRESVAELAAAGVDAVKLYAHLDEPRLRAAVDSAHHYGLAAIAHLGDVTVQQAAAAGVDEIEHFSGCRAAWEPSDVTQRAELTETLLDAGIVMCPTIVVWDRLSRPFDPVFARDAQLDLIPDDMRTTWQNNAYRHRGVPARLDLQASVVNMKRTLGDVHRAGVPIIAGSDTPFPYLIPGFSLHDELAMMVDAGLTPVEALRAATSSAAKALRLPGVIGSIAAGARADLLAASGNPLADLSVLSDIAAVFRAGIHLTPTDLRLASLDACRDRPESPIDRSLREWAGRDEPPRTIDRSGQGHG